MSLKYIRLKLPTPPNTVVETRGINFGGPVSIVDWIGDNLVLHKPAYTVWTSRGETGTDPAVLMVCTLFEDNEGETWGSFFFEKETSRYWRTVQEEAKAVAAAGRGDLPKWGIALTRNIFI